MRRLALVALCLAAVGCGEGDEVGESGACANGIVWHETLYLYAEIDPPRPPAGPPLEGGIRPGCNDSNGAFEEDAEIDVREVQGLPPDVAVYTEGSIAGIYVNNRYFVFLGDRDHPPPRPFDSPTCTFEGTVVRTSPLRVRTQRRTWRVRVDADTRFAGFDSSVPYLAEGDRVWVRGHRCAGKGMIPRRIEALP